MLPHFAQERDIAQLVQPFGIVDDDRIGGTIAKGQEPFEHASDAGDVLRDNVVGQKLARFVLEAWIADLASAATHHHDGFVAGLLQPPQQHDLHQRSDVQRWRGGIEADIARHNLLHRKAIKRCRVGHLVDIATLIEQAEKIGLVCGHDTLFREQRGA